MSPPTIGCLDGARCLLGMDGEEWEEVDEVSETAALHRRQNMKCTLVGQARSED